VATAKSPAMLMYLDKLAEHRAGFAGGQAGACLSQAVYADDAVWRAAGARTRCAGEGGIEGPRVNENYGRELMELHTLGVNGGYTQKDVTRLRRSLPDGRSTSRLGAGSSSSTTGGTSRERRRCWGRRSRERHERGAGGAAHAGDQPGDGEVHLDRAGGAVCERRSAAGAGGPDGAVVPVERWRHQDGAADDVRVAGVLGACDGAGQGEDAGGVCDIRGAGERRYGEHSLALVQALDKLGMRCMGCRRRTAIRG